MLNPAFKGFDFQVDKLKLGWRYSVEPFLVRASTSVFGLGREAIILLPIS
jgi:hypothetical protein